MRRVAWKESNDRLPWTADPADSYIAQGRSRLPVIELQIVVEPSASCLRRLNVGDLDVDLRAQFR